MQNVKISIKLFHLLIRYHLLGDADQTGEDIKKELEKKMDALIRHELYSTYKTAPSETDREKARKKYLDQKGIPEDFRW